MSDVPHLDFTVRHHWHDLNSHPIGPSKYIELVQEPLFVANKANARLKSFGQRGPKRRFGGKQWDEVKAFEESIGIACAAALADRPEWQRRVFNGPCRATFAVVIVLEFGARDVRVKATKGRRPYIRRDTAKRRYEACDVDSVKAILDGLEGYAFPNDAQVDRLSVEKVERKGDVLGDIIHIRVKLLTGEEAA